MKSSVDMLSTDLDTVKIYICELEDRPEEITMMQGIRLRSWCYSLIIIIVPLPLSLFFSFCSKILFSHLQGTRYSDGQVRQDSYSYETHNLVGWYSSQTNKKDRYW